VYHDDRVRKKKKKTVCFARTTNLDLPKKDVLKMYNKVRGPIETSYRNIKSFLRSTGSTKFVFRTLIFLLAMTIYSLFTIFNERAKREEFRLLLILALINNVLENYIVELEEPLTNAVDIFLRR
jgi:putative transposase